MTKLIASSVGIIGDYMLDIHFDTVPAEDSNKNKTEIFKIKNITYYPGGAGTIARLLNSTKMFDVNCIGTIGNDWAGKIIYDYFSSRNTQNFLVFNKNHTRLRGYLTSDFINKFRIDRDPPASGYCNIPKLELDYIVISDFNYGCNNISLENIIFKLSIAAINNKNIKKYFFADFLVLNALEQIKGKNQVVAKDVVILTKAIRKNGYKKNIIITNNSDGLYLSLSNNNFYHINALRVNEKNPVGSGDTFVTGLLIGLDKGMSIINAVRVGAYLAGESVKESNIGLKKIEVDKIKYQEISFRSLN